MGTRPGATKSPGSNTMNPPGKNPASSQHSPAQQGTSPRSPGDLPARGQVSSQYSPAQQGKSPCSPGNYTPTPSRDNLLPISHINRQVLETKQEDLIAAMTIIEQVEIDLSEMARDKPLDAKFYRLVRDARYGLSFRKVDIGGRSLLVDISNGSACTWVLTTWRRRIFDTVHNLGHPGVHKTTQMISAKFMWPN